MTPKCHTNSDIWRWEHHEGCFSATGFHITKGMMNGKMYQDVLDKNLMPSTRMMEMKRGERFSKIMIPNTAEENSANRMAQTIISSESTENFKN